MGIGIGIFALPFAFAVAFAVPFASWAWAKTGATIIVMLALLGPALFLGPVLVCVFSY